MHIKNSFVAFAVAALTFISAPAIAHDVVYTGTFSTAGEAVLSPTPSQGTGTATVTFNLDTFIMRVQATFSGLTGTTTASHIHCCTTTAGTGSAGVATVTPTFTLFPLGVTSGTYDFTYDMSQASSYNPAFVNAAGGVLQALSAFSTGLDSGKAYLNIHTSAATGGEIRAFLVAAPVPEPETYGMLLAGLALVGAVARRRKVAL